LSVLVQLIDWFPAFVGVGAFDGRVSSLAAGHAGTVPASADEAPTSKTAQISVAMAGAQRTPNPPPD
jgi:hypothetical protein